MNLSYLKIKHKDSLFDLLQKHEKMCDGTSGIYTGSDGTIEMKGSVKTFRTKRFNLLSSQKPTLKKE